MRCNRLINCIPTILLFQDMQILDSPASLRDACRNWRKAGETVALVPTMGYYHAGHEDLIRHARGLADRLVVSLFVNPAQFGPDEDLDAYPRDPERDAAIAARLGADILFMPAPEAMYRPEHGTWVEAPELGRSLCGRSRPIHFRGVCTIVLKLFMLTQADFAVFGQKDWQQQAIIRAMALDLNLDTQIVTRPTTREPDGLAMSSRNVYLKPEERAQAPQIRKALLEAASACRNGETDCARLRADTLAFWQENLPLGEVDYLEIVHPETLKPLETIAGPALMACAVKVGKARLIDNILLTDKGA